MLTNRNCDSVRPLLAGLREGWLDPRTRRIAESHVAACDSCAREIERDSRLSALLSRTPARAPHPVGPTWRDVAARHGLQLDRPQPGQRLRWFVPATTVAAMALLLLVARIETRFPSPISQEGRPSAVSGLFPEARADTLEFVEAHRAMASHSISGGSPPARFGPGSWSAMPSAAEVERATGRPLLYPSFVPTGFHATLFGVMRTGSGRLMPAVRYSDGHAAFTVFQRGRARRGPLPGCYSALGESVVVIQTKKSNYILVGDIASSLLQKVASSLP